jgi:hypothetical protein
MRRPLEENQHIATRRRAQAYIPKKAAHQHTSDRNFPCFAHARFPNANMGRNHSQSNNDQTERQFHDTCRKRRCQSRVLPSILLPWQIQESKRVIPHHIHETNEPSHRPSGTFTARKRPAHRSEWKNLPARRGCLATIGTSRPNIPSRICLHALPRRSGQGNRLVVPRRSHRFRPH